MKRPTSCLRAVVIGNGSSVDALPPEAWRVLDVRGPLWRIGTNRALVFSALANVRLDVLVLRDRPRRFWLDQRWGSLYEQQFVIPFSRSGGWVVGHDRTAYADEHVCFAKDWQSSCPESPDGLWVMHNSSAVLMAVNWAWLCGCRDIAMIGVDYCGPHAAMIERWSGAEMAYQGLYDKPVPPHIEKDFAFAANAITDEGGRLVNLSAKSALKAVEPMDWQAWSR
ncbi:MAG: hypothetical protein ABFD92_16815 [Planctomycetaceae bacterium]|nr:hypothetical protein [Planctomycetaceae bacterium]